MRRWLKRTLIGMFGASVLVGGLAAAHRNHYHGHGWHGGDHAARFQAHAVDWVVGELALDAGQKARLVALADRLREQRDALWGAGADPYAEFTALLSGPSFDRARAKALVDAKADALLRGSPAWIDALGDFFDGLRPEQQAKARELMTQRGRHGWRG